MVCHVCFISKPSALCDCEGLGVCSPRHKRSPDKRRSASNLQLCAHQRGHSDLAHISPPPSWILYGHETNSGERNNKGRPPPLPQDPGTWLQSGKHAAEGGWSRREPNVYHEPPTPSDRTSDMQHPAATETGISEVPHEYTHTLRQPLPPQERRGSAALFRCLDKYSLSGNQTGA